jgi:hypothetical protein
MKQLLCRCLLVLNLERADEEAKTARNKKPRSGSRERTSLFNCWHSRMIFETMNLRSEF